MRERQILPIVAPVVALAIGCAKKVDDTALVTSIQSQMFSDSQLKDANLQVASNKGQVTLTGTVSSSAAHLDAYKIATQTPGVTSVNDQVTVQEPQAAQAAPALAPAEAQPPAKTSKKRREAREARRKNIMRDRRRKRSRRMFRRILIQRLSQRRKIKLKLHRHPPNLPRLRRPRPLRRHRLLLPSRGQCRSTRVQPSQFA